jgi:hypothetical protein
LWPNYQINETHTLLLLLADADDGRTFRTSGANLFLKLALSTLCCRWGEKRGIIIAFG